MFLKKMEASQGVCGLQLTGEGLQSTLDRLPGALAASLGSAGLERLERVPNTRLAVVFDLKAFFRASARASPAQIAVVGGESAVTTAASSAVAVGP